MYAGISLEKIYTRKKCCWELPSTCKLSKEYRVSLAAAKKKKFGRFEEHTAVFESFYTAVKPFKKKNSEW